MLKLSDEELKKIGGEVNDELLKILDDLLNNCRAEVNRAEERVSWAEDRVHAVQLVIDMLKKEAK